MKKVYFLLILSILSLVSCGEPKKAKKSSLDNQISMGNRIHTTTDPAFFTLIRKFEEWGREIYQDENFQVGNIPINFGDTGDYAGVCITYASGAKEILINDEKWPYGGIQESVIFHELGHCRLNLEHNDEIYGQGTSARKVSIMSTILMDDRLLYEFKYEHLHELFTGDNGPIIEALKDL